MSDQEHFVIKRMRLVDQETCEVYMLNTTKKVMKGWLIHCHQNLHVFHEQMNDLLQSKQPFQTLLLIKHRYQVEVIN